MTVEERLQRELAEAARIGVRSTPTFFLGIKSSDGRISLRSRINGAQPFDVFASAINNLARQVSKGGS
jgi:predicted DsbA family dithiol-disulfide isomerase